jgi:hypothetical protein
MPREFPNELLNKRGTDATSEVIEEKSLGTEHPLEQAAEHPQHEHVEEDMGEVLCIVHEHVGEGLPNLKLRTSPKMKSEPLHQVRAIDAHEHYCGKPQQYVNHEQMPCNRRYRRQKRPIVVLH